MKNLLIVLGLIVAVSLYFFLSDSEVAPSSTATYFDVSDNNIEKQQKMQTIKQLMPVEKSVEANGYDAMSLLEKVEFILEDAHSSSDKYKLLLALLKENEMATLEMLGNFHFPQDLSLDDPRHEQILMVNRAMLEFYRDKTLADTLEKFEVMRSSDLLYGYVVHDLFFAAEGSENTDTSYNWILENPDEYAAQSSGRTIGGKLADYNQEEALDKALMLPEGTIRSQAFSTLVSSLAQDDFDAAIEFVQQAEQSEDYDQVISDMVSMSLEQEKSFEDIVQIAISPIQDNYRLGTLTTLFNRWAEKDASALQAWLEDNEDNYSEEQFTEINVFAKQALNRFLVN